MSKRCYAVVGFSSDNSTEVVPTSWLHDGKDEGFACYWPGSNAIARAKKCEVPDTERWRSEAVRVFCYADTYQAASEKCDRILDTSTIESSDEDIQEIKRRTKKPRRLVEEEEDSPDERSVKMLKTPSRGLPLPEPPQIRMISRISPSVSSSASFTKKSGTSSLESINSPTGSLEENGRKEVPSFSPSSIVRSSVSPGDYGFSPVYETSLHRSYRRNDSHTSPACSSPYQPIPTESYVHTDRLPQLVIPHRRKESAFTPEIAEKIFQKLNTLEKNQEEMMTMMRKLVAGKNSTDVVVEDVVQNPCKSYEELIQLCESIQESDFRKKLTTLLGTLAGHKLGESVRKMLAVLGTNALWAEYSLKGKRNKRSFSALPLSKVVIRACLKIHTNSNVQQVEDAISETLKHAPFQKDGPRYKKRVTHEDGQDQRPAREQHETDSE